MQTFVVKFAGAFSGFLSGIGLTVIGYKANVEQSLMTENGMRIIMFLIPAILSGLCYVVFRKGYKLTPDFYKKVKESLHSGKEN